MGKCKAPKRRDLVRRNAELERANRNLIVQRNAEHNRGRVLQDYFYHRSRADAAALDLFSMGRATCDGYPVDDDVPF